MSLEGNEPDDEVMDSADNQEGYPRTEQVRQSGLWQREAWTFLSPRVIRAPLPIFLLPQTKQFARRVGVESKQFPRYRGELQQRSPEDTWARSPAMWNQWF